MNLSSSAKGPPLTRRRRKEIASLTQRKYRERLGQTLVEGRRSIASAIEAGAPLVEVLVAESTAADPDVRRLLERCQAPTYEVPDAEIAAISAVETSQGVLGVAAIHVVSIAEIMESERILALDGLQDPGNAGTLIRTAAWFGVDAIVTAQGTVDLYSPKVVRATMGALWDLKHAHVDDLAGLLEALRASGFRAYGADLNGRDVRRWEPAPKSVLVLGSEGHGLSGPVAAVLDERVAIPGASSTRGTESLNVAVAAAIILYEWSAGGNA